MSVVASPRMMSFMRARVMATFMQESDVSLIIGSYEADQDNIPFLALEPVHGVNRDEFPQGDKKAVSFDDLSDILYLHPIRGYQPEIDSFIQYSFDTDFLDIFL